MATNQIYTDGPINLVVADPASPVSGNAVLIGSLLTGVALTNMGAGSNISTETTVDCREAVWSLPVKASAGGVSIFDPVYYDSSIHGLSNDSTKVFFGFALAAVVSGQTTTINVKHINNPNVSSLAAALDGSNVKVTSNADANGNIPLLHRINIAAGALGNTDTTITRKERVIDAWLVLTGAGVSTTTLQVFNGSNAITDAMAASGSQNALVRCASINSTYWEISAGGTLRVTSATGATQPNAVVFVLTVPV